MKTLKITRMLVSRITAATNLLKICLSNRLIDNEIFLSVEKRCPVAILFVNISLATVTSSQLNDENSAKARYVDETHSYRLINFEINKSNQ